MQTHNVNKTADRTEHMTAQRQREIVIEFEKVRMIRRRAVTTLLHCSGCGGQADFVALRAAAELFETPDRDLANFVAANEVHTGTGIDICIPSLLAVMQKRTNGNDAKFIGGSTARIGGKTTE